MDDFRKFSPLMVIVLAGLFGLSTVFCCCWGDMAETAAQREAGCCRAGSGGFFSADSPEIMSSGRNEASCYCHDNKGIALESQESSFKHSQADTGHFCVASLKTVTDDCFSACSVPGFRNLAGSPTRLFLQFSTLRL